MHSRSPEERREDLVALYREARGCPRCPLARSRTNVVFGAGNANADLMFVGEAPGFHEDQQALPFVGRAGKLLDELLQEIGLKRTDVFIANVLKCLRYNTPVQLGDGTWERIGRLVRSGYGGTVMSVDDQGQLVPRHVTGWHATPLGGRSVYRMSYASAKRTGSARVSTQLTGDHRVLTERGYVRADELQSGDRVATGQGLSPVAWDVACGTLLGDASINRNSSYLSFSHSDSQASYAWFKLELLAELSPRYGEHEVAAVAGGEACYPVVQVRTLAHRALGTLRDAFYGTTKKVPSWLFDQLNERMLAIWFMDDGHLRLRPPRQPSASIATQCFSARDLQILLGALARLGLPAKVSGGRELTFDVETTKKLSAAIAPYVPAPMRYKLHPDIDVAVPFDATRFRPAPPITQFDEVAIEEVTHQARADTTFFCIDVDETHNFVTAGGVVHNCRPPGNRDPQPDEIDACKPYLFRQVELIEPRVVCTLGNFATKLLTRSNRGITGVHGQPQEHELGARKVRIYPLFHPAAALRTPAVRAQLQEDFARLPALLAEPPPAPLVPVPVAVEPDQLRLG